MSLAGGREGEGEEGEAGGGEKGMRKAKRRERDGEGEIGRWGRKEG